MSKLILPLLMLVLSPFATTACADDGSGQRMRFLASRLDAVIKEIDKGDQPLPLLLESLCVWGSESAPAKDPAKAMAIVVNDSAFQILGRNFDFERMVIKFNCKLQNIKLATALEMICAQFDAGYVVRKDFVEILPIEFLRKELNHPYGPDRDLRSLVTRFYENVSLKSALDDLAEKNGRTVIASAKVQKELEQAISVRLINLPFETAVETLADMADLKLVRKSNVLLVTTKEHAAELNAEHEKCLKAVTEQAEKEKAKEKQEGK